MNFWCDHANAALAEFLLRSSARVDFDDIASLATGNADGDLAVLVDKVRAVGHRVVLCNLTTPDVASLGFSVVRAVIPGFHPLFMGFTIRALGGRRLWDVAGKFGGTRIGLDAPDNFLPHPYP